MQYNIFFEISAAALLIVLNLYVRLQYPSRSPSNIHFKRLIAFLLLAVTLDVTTALTISYAVTLPVPIWLNILLNTAYFGTDILLECEFVLYCTCIIFGDTEHRHIPEILMGVKVTGAALLFANVFTGWIFTFDETGYVHGPIYMVVHIIPLLTITVTSYMLFSRFPQFRVSQRISIIIYFLVLISGPVVQLINPSVLFILFTVSIGVMMLMFAMETPDFHALIKTMEELRVTRDEAEEAMAAAQSASQAKTDFLSSMSHEVRTPINAILGYNEMVLRDTDDPEIIRCSGNIQKAGKTLLSMISDMMDYTEMETGSFHIEENNYSTASMLSDITTCGRYYSEKKALELRIDFDTAIPRTLTGDSVRITRIFNNLVSNAVKYTDSGYVGITIRWESGGSNEGYLCAQVRDTGIGMKEEDISRISSSFLRLEKKRNQGIQGIGLGLTIVTRLLTMMGSSLEVDSDYGSGTNMRFRLKQGVVDPAPIGDVSSLAGSTEKVRGGPGYSAPEARILAVDDNVMNLDLYKTSLKAAGINIDTATNGVEALELISRSHYDLIMLDHMMPIMDGMETLKTIKKQNLCPGVPILIVTANAVSGEKDSYLNAGFDDYLSKPVSSRQLWETVRRYLPERLVHTEDAPADTPSKGHCSVMKQLGEFLDTAQALKYCCDSEDLYLEILHTYLDEDKTQILLQYMNENDLENYRIQVHALKSGSRTIGATALSDDALQLENAAKQLDSEYIKANTERVLNKYGELTSRLRSVLDGSASYEGESTGGRVLYVDDDILYRCLVDRILSDRFGGVTALQSGEEALKYLEDNTPEVILIDLRLGGMDGLALLRSIKSDERLESIPVVIFTSESDSATEVRCLRAGAADYIRKPVECEVLVERIGKLVG